MTRRRFAVAVLFFILVSLPAVAATFVVPDDETFIRKADVIVTGTVLDSYSQYADNGRIETVYRLAVDELLKGEAGEILEIREWGGVIGSRFTVMSGAPEYEVGKRYLVFLTPFRDGRLTTLDLVLGQFRFVEHEGQQILERDRREILDLGESGRLVDRPAKQFVQRIREQVTADRRVVISSDGTIVPEVNNLNTQTAATIGAGAWSSGTNVNFSVSGSAASADTLNEYDSEARIIIDDPHNEIAGTFNGSGTVATAFFGGSILSDRIAINSGADIVVQDGVSSATMTQNNYNSTMTHEMGHTLGFRHSNQNQYSQTGTSCAAPLPCSSSAIMNSTIVGGLNGNLQSWDQAAVNNNYGSAPDTDYLIIAASQGDKPWYRNSPSASWRITDQTPPCTGPSISAQPTAMPSSITTGQSSTLSVSATAGTGSVSYQWYVGNTSGSGTPISGATGATTVVTPNATTRYWVRVTDGCSSVNSNIVTVEVTVGCSGPTVSQPSASPSTINAGQSSTLSVFASASEGSLSYQWYIGSSGQTNNPISGATGSSVQVSPTSTTSYWVRVTDGCNGGTSRNSSTVTVTLCVPPQITVEPQDTSVELGKSVTLSTSASGTNPIIRWYRGNLGDTSTLLTTSSAVTVSPTVDTMYWARATNSCGQDDTRQVTVTVTGGCEAPVITQQPQSTSIQAGETATLFVVATGTTLTYQWYRVEGANFIAIPGATAPSYTTPPLDAMAAYLVQITNGCGQVNSNQVFVNVSTCDAPVITVQPQSVVTGRGARVELSVVATGTAPLSYQWYEGQSGAPSVGIPGATSPTLVIRPTETKSYWVRVTNECDSIDSATATVEVKSFRRRAVRRH